MKFKASQKELKEFGILIGVLFPLLVGWILPLVTGHDFRIWTLWIGIPTIILSRFAPRSLFLPYQAWMSLGGLLGWVNSHIILGLIFLLVVQPIAFLMQVFKYDPLKRKKTTQVSYREVRKTKSIDLRRIF